MPSASLGHYGRSEAMKGGIAYAAQILTPVMPVSNKNMTIRRAQRTHDQYEDWVSTCQSRATQRFYATRQVNSKIWYKKATETL